MGADKRHEEAREHLEDMERQYAAIGSPGAFVRELVLRPLRDRWNAGERTDELLTAIMEVE